MNRQNSGARRPIGGGESSDTIVNAPESPPQARRRQQPRRCSSGSSSCSSSSSLGQHLSLTHQALSSPRRGVSFKTETRVRIIHSWRNMSEREWCQTWVTVSFGNLLVFLFTTLLPPRFHQDLRTFRPCSIACGVTSTCRSTQ